MTRARATAAAGRGGRVEPCQGVRPPPRSHSARQTRLAASALRARRPRLRAPRTGRADGSGRRPRPKATIEGHDSTESCSAALARPPTRHTTWRQLRVAPAERAPVAIARRARYPAAGDGHRAAQLSLRAPLPPALAPGPPHWPGAAAPAELAVRDRAPGDRRLLLLPPSYHGNRTPSSQQLLCSRPHGLLCCLLTSAHRQHFLAFGYVAVLVGQLQGELCVCVASLSSRCW